MIVTHSPNTRRVRAAVNALSIAVLAAALAVAAHSPARSTMATKAASTPTYARDIAPILYANCDNCHRAGQIAPFALTSFADAQKRAMTIAAATQSRFMPPWKAQPGFGHFADDRRLTDAQIQTIHDWAAAGAPEGNVADLPPMPQFPVGWSLGNPDVVMQPSEPYNIAADGNDVYRCFVIPSGYTENKWLAGIEVHPGNHRIVHHIIAYLDTSGTAAKLAAASTDGPGYTSFGGPGFRPSGTLGGWAPGNDPALLPNGTGIFLPKGADIVLQVHYHKDGKPESDLTKIGLFFSKAPVDKRIRTLMVIDPFLSIPAGDSNYEAKASATVPADITVRDIMPHMHLLGHDMTVTAALPDGTTVPLVKVSDWDFNWQNKYVYVDPIELPKGTKISLVAHYDNSADNPRNPNTPPKLVTWGEQTTDEMCISFINYTVDSEHLQQGVIATVPSQTARDSMVDELISHFDKDGDGKLDATELASLIAYLQSRNPAAGSGGAPQADPQKLATGLIAMFDKAGDGKLDKAELIAAGQFMKARAAAGR